MSRVTRAIDPRELPDDVLAKFRGKSYADTAHEREKTIARSKKALADVVSGEARKPRALQSDEEHAGQTLFFQIELHKLIAKYGEHLDDVFAIPNFAGRLGSATRNIGKRLKAEGRKKGVFDICYPRARGDWHALYIEAKVDPKRPSEEQRNFQLRMIEAGNLAVVTYGHDAQSLCASIKQLISIYEDCGPYHALCFPREGAYQHRARLAGVWEWRA